jgi:hypothetical protein
MNMRIKPIRIRTELVRKRDLNKRKASKGTRNIHFIFL